MTLIDTWYTHYTSTVLLFRGGCIRELSTSDAFRDAATPPKIANMNNIL